MHIQAVLFLLHFVLFANAGVYFIQPETGSSCAAGHSCVLSWLDDGDAPSIPSIGVLVQAIPPLNVATVHSIQFTPNAQAGPNSDSYYIAFISTNEKVNGSQYAAFSPFFTLTGMSGSFSSPLASATDTFSVPASLSRTGSLSNVTITVGNPISTATQSTPPPSAPPSSAPSSSKSQTLSSSLTPASTSTTSASTPASTFDRILDILTIHSLDSASVFLTPLSLPILAVLSLCAVMFY
ncbi:hypothetical protein B0H16DRAFT_1495006 [Mycena metata]|uniref:Uncharacterized protein n=1 Tax=Mycena metata TaxID=1033252 RepID=A0AAD7KCX0_9AGAR|nr:hypothetical protein B0H16DRAFT_1495006 [Mycena metata]